MCFKIKKPLENSCPCLVVWAGWVLLPPRWPRSSDTFRVWPSSDGGKETLSPQREEGAEQERKLLAFFGHGLWSIIFRWLCSLFWGKFLSGGSWSRALCSRLFVYFSVEEKPSRSVVMLWGFCEAYTKMPRLPGLRGKPEADSKGNGHVAACGVSGSLRTPGPACWLLEWPEARDVGRLVENSTSRAVPLKDQPFGL